MRYKTLVMSLFFFALTVVGCGGSSSTETPPGNGGSGESSSSSSSDNTGGDSGGELGQVTLTASGAVTGQFSGMMDFHYMEFDDFGVEGASWELSGHDGADGSQSFSLTISVESFDAGGDGIARPEVGTYDIGFEANSTQVFNAIFTHIGEGGFTDSTEYASDMDTHTGTLTITESNADTVSGTFVADLYWEDYCTAEGCVGDSINITGEFTAHNRIF
ncbi:hypothetical protein [Marinimicrobium alkaliphilum]|uniref:hypothetical protein n=1 Tax=Marinimicrobium alkaliphilum TaxID=2202654 RepID=UPI000DBA0F48|nr:hypothetical protein [Marinimicrobium alkaliphilum]